jgi:hypothetical protein
VVLGPTRSLAFTSTRDGVLATTTARRAEQSRRKSRGLAQSLSAHPTDYSQRCKGDAAGWVHANGREGWCKAGEGANVAKEDENSDWQQRQRSDVPVAKELGAPEAG